MEENRFEQNIEQDPQTQQTPVMAPAPKQKKKHMGLAIASLILSGLSILCCWIYGFAIIPGIICYRYIDNGDQLVSHYAGCFEYHHEDRSK